MKGRFNTRQRNYIILGLCSILLIMAAGYAAFRTQLNINGTSNITSEWKVLITNIESKVLSGTPTDAETPSHTETMAKFSTKLVSPGDSMQYDITVENKGDIDAVLESIDVNASENEAILFETSGIKRGDKLAPDASDILTVIVTYNPEITNQPDNLNAEVTVTLNYVQDDGTIEPEPDGPNIGGVSVPTVGTGDGLYEDENESGRYVYRGSNPNNYIEFNGELWKIIAKETDGTYKILRNEVLPEGMPFDSAGARTTGYCSKGSAPTSGCNAWAANVNLVGSPSEFTNGTITGTVDADSEMLAYLNGEYLKSITINKDKIVSHDYNIGGVSYGNDDLATQIEGEKAYRWNGNVALINVSDYINANSNQELCGTHKNYNGNYATCNLSNYLFNNKTWWLLNPIYSNNRFNFALYEIGNIAQPQSKDMRFVRPAVYLTSNLSLSGSGTQSDPFVIVS